MRKKRTRANKQLQKKKKTPLSCHAIYSTQSQKGFKRIQNDDDYLLKTWHYEKSLTFIRTFFCWITWNGFSFISNEEFLVGVFTWPAGTRLTNECLFTCGRIQTGVLTGQVRRWRCGQTFSVASMSIWVFRNVFQVKFQSFEHWQIIRLIIHRIMNTWNIFTMRNDH